MLKRKISSAKSINSQIEFRNGPGQNVPDIKIGLSCLTLILTDYYQSLTSFGFP